MVLSRTNPFQNLNKYDLLKECQASAVNSSNSTFAFATAVFPSTVPFRTSVKPWTAADTIFSPWQKRCWLRRSTLSGSRQNGSICRTPGQTAHFSICTAEATLSAPASPIGASPRTLPRHAVAVCYCPNTAWRPSTLSLPPFWTHAPLTDSCWHRGIRLTASSWAASHPAGVSRWRFCRHCGMKGCRCRLARFCSRPGPICWGRGTVYNLAPNKIHGCVPPAFHYWRIATAEAPLQIIRWFLRYMVT